jgi:hypothetical protein
MLWKRYVSSVRSIVALSFVPLHQNLRFMSNPHVDRLVCQGHAMMIKFCRPGRVVKGVFPLQATGQKEEDAE